MPNQDEENTSLYTVDSGVHMGPRAPLSCNLKYELPSTVVSIRDGWQWTSQSGAVVSGLLAAVAAQLLSLFKSTYTKYHASQGTQDFIVAACYAALFLNIGATITSFILIDDLGEIGYQASCKTDDVQVDTTGRVTTQQDQLLVLFGASPKWKTMLLYWLFMFYSGILALIVSILAYVWAEEPIATKVAMSVIVGLIILPSTYLILVRPLHENRRRVNKKP